LFETLPDAKILLKSADEKAQVDLTFAGRTIAAFAKWADENWIEDMTAKAVSRQGAVFCDATQLLIFMAPSLTFE